MRMSLPDLGRKLVQISSKPRFRLNFAAFGLMAYFFAFYFEIFTPMYTLQDFRVMPFEKKCDLITFRGSYLTQRMLADCKVFLYFAGDFFIEVF